MYVSEKNLYEASLTSFLHRFLLWTIYRKTYKCKNCADDEHTPILKAELPVPVMKKSMATPATVAYVMQKKYQLGMPLNRQEQYWKS